MELYQQLDIEGNYFSNNHNYLEAIRCYEELIKIENSSDAYINLSIAFTKNSRPNEGIEALKNLIKLKPNNITGISNLVILYIEERKFEESSFWTEYGLKINPTSIEIILLKGVTMFRMNKYNEALELFLKIISIYPNYIGVYYNLANTLFHLKEYNQCVYWIDKKLEIDINDHISLLLKTKAIIEINKMNFKFTTINDLIKVNPLLEKFNKENFFFTFFMNNLGRILIFF